MARKRRPAPITVRMISQLRAWWLLATAEERQQLADEARTSLQYLYRLTTDPGKRGHRAPSAELGARIETATRTMAKASKGRLPVVWRTDTVQACRECAFAARCLGRDRAEKGHFGIPITEAA